MSLLSIAQDLSVLVSIATPTAVLSNLTDDNKKIIRFTTEAAEELARRADWSALRKGAVLTGTGTNSTIALPTDFSRLVEGNSVRHSSGSPVRVGLTADEWNSILGVTVQGTPRYAQLFNAGMAFYPYMAVGDTVTVIYQSKSWCTSGTAWGSDSEAALVPESLIRMGAVWRWRRHHGQDIQDHLAEFESAFADRMRFDEGIRLP